VDVRLLQSGVGVKNFGRGHPASQEMENEGNPDPMTADARLAEADVRINSNALKEFLVRHGGIIPLNEQVVILGSQGRRIGCPTRREGTQQGLPQAGTASVQQWQELGEETIN